MSPRKFYKTVVTLTIISEECPIEFQTPSDLDYELRNNEHAYSFTDVDVERLNAVEAVQELIYIDESPSFFMLDDNGENLPQ